MRGFFLFSIILLSLSLLEAKKPSNALLKSYKQALKEYKKDPYSYDKSMKLAYIAFDAGNFKQAYDLVLIALEQKNNDVDALILYANVLIEYGYEAKARRKLALIIELYPQTKSSQRAKKTLKMLDRLHNPFQKQYKLELSAGLDSNPSYSSKNPYLSNFFVTIACQKQGPGCDFNNRFKSLNSYVDASFKADSVYDVGSLGGFFLTYGWQISTRSYIENIDAGDLSLGINYGFGLSTRHSGSFHLPFAINENMNRFAINDDETFKYFSFKIKPHYRYRFEDRSLFSVGIEHEEQDSSSQFYYDMGSTEYSSNITFLFLSYQTKIKNSHPLYFKLYVGSQDEGFKDYFDYNTTKVPYMEYDFAGLDASFVYKLNSKKSYKGSMKFQRRIYFDHHEQDNFTPFIHSPRVDRSLEVNTQVNFFNSDLSKTVLGYKLYANITNYEPLDFVKHELYYSYYWLP